MTDTLLCQVGGIGGPYNSITISGLAASFSGQGQISVGLPLPPDALNTGILGSSLITPIGCTRGWNWYKNTAGTGTANSYLASGLALQECFSAAGTLTYNIAATGTASAPVTAWSPIFTLGPNGQITQPANASIALGRAATATNEAVTLAQLNAVQANTVISFNGRQGVVTLALADVTGAGGAPINNPNLTGSVQAPTPTATDNSNLVATTAFVHNAVAAAVTSFNGRTGAITLTTADITGAGGAPIASPALTGTPTAPTPTAGNSSTNIATTAFVANAIGAAVVSFNGRTGAVVLTLADITSVGGAPLLSPSFSGVPNAPTANVGTSTSQLATCAFVQAAVTAATTGVVSWNTRTGAVTMTGTDITNAGGALLNSPGLTGTPTCPTAVNGTSTTQIASTAFVMNEIAGVSAGVTTFNTRSGNVVLQLTDITGAGGAPIASPSFSGTPTAPTPPGGNSSTDIATTAFVANAVAGAVTSFNGRTGAVTLTNNDISAAGGLANPSPIITGSPTAPTAPPGTNTTQLATTQFVASAISNLTPTIVSGTAPASPLQGQGWFNLNVGQLYVWTGSAWVVAVNPPVPNLSGYALLSGATFTGPVVLPAGSTVAGYVPLAGNVNITGNVGFNYPLPANVAPPSAAGAHVFGWIAAFQNLAMNVYYDGTSWRRETTNFPPLVISPNASNQMVFLGAAAGGTAGGTVALTQLMTLDTTGILAVSSYITAGGYISAAGYVVGAAGLYAVNTNSMFIGSGGSGRILQMSPNWYWDWNISTGELHWLANTGQMLSMRTTDSLMWNNAGPVGGYGAYQNLSDPRAKQNIEPATTGLAEILALEPIRFIRIPQPMSDDPNMPSVRFGRAIAPEVGFNAEQVREHFPEAVSIAGFTLPDGSGGLDTDQPSLAIQETAIVAALVNAVKTLDARIHVLEGGTQAHTRSHHGRGHAS